MRNSSVSAFFTNRSLCHIKLQQWTQAAADARRALELEPNSIKGHFFLGQALLELDQFEEAIKHVQKANDLSKEKKLNFGDEITFLLRIAKKKRWNQLEEKRISGEIELQTYLGSLINRDREEQLTNIRQSFCDESIGSEELTLQENKVISKCDKYLSDLSEMFNELDIRRKKRDIPDYMCGKISFEIMKDPVITPSGITYDRKDIEEHLQRVGHFDPVTRHPLTADQLISNLSMKEVVDAFLIDNEWANEY